MSMGAYTQQEKYWIWLGSMTEVGPKTFYYIMSEFGDAASFFDAVMCGSDMLELLPAKVRNAVKAACSHQYLAELIGDLKKKHIRAVTRLSAEYPPLLATIPYPPPVLYVKGSLQGIGKTLGIVGTRRCTRKGAEAAQRIAKELSENGVTVVSGMARGIDTAAHKGAIDATAKTVAVFGCGVDIVYPPENEDIYHYAMGNGAVISELVAGTKPFCTNFPARNRIITGMCAGTLIVESGMEGGTAISAWAAIAQGRDVFAMPGMPGLPMSELPNTLIRRGAVPVTCADDILRCYGNIDHKIENKNSILGNQTEIQLDFLQREIYNLLMQGDMSVEAIAQRIAYEQSEINVTLTMMELGGLIKRLPGGRYGV